MRYRKLGATDLSVSEIGLGFEHLLDKEQEVVSDTVNAAVEGGINYFDCLSHKHDYYKLGNALSGIRDKVIITYLANSEMPPEKTEEDFQYFLKQVRTDYVDIFIIACCDKTSEYEKVTGNNSLLTCAMRLRDEQKIGYIGLSTHVSDIAFKVIDSKHFDVLMYPVNPAFDVITDEEQYISNDIGHLWEAAYSHPTDVHEHDILRRKSVYTECLRNNIGLVAMKPFAAGWLFRPDINTGFTPVNLISYALTQTGVSTVIPGCSNKDEVENILTYHSCTNEERDFSCAVSSSRWRIKGNCQYCSHCLPCTSDIEIAQVNRFVDNKTGDEYQALTVKASACVKCGKCESRCPFDVDIMKKMDTAVQLFE